MTDFEAQSESTRQLERNTYDRWTTNESQIKDPEFVNVRVTNIERPQRQIKLITSFVTTQLDPS